MAGAENEATQERNERLQLLRDRTEQWADDEIARLDYEKAYLENVLQGRAPRGTLEGHIREFTSTLVQDEIDSFLGA